MVAGYLFNVCFLLSTIFISCFCISVSIIEYLLFTSNIFARAARMFSLRLVPQPERLNAVGGRSYLR